MDRVFLVGHDWGAAMAWYFCLLKPDRVKALVNMSVVFRSRNPVRKPVQTMRAMMGDDYYMCRFQVNLVLILKIFMYLANLFIIYGDWLEC